MAEVRTDAKKRIEDEIPPGYLDAKKDGDARLGDVILWHQLCDRAVETGKPIVLVSDDQKADWIWEVRGKTVGPRPELVAEMSEKAKVGFHIYTPVQLMQVWRERGEGRTVEQEVLDEIEAPSSMAEISSGEVKRMGDDLVTGFTSAVAGGARGIVAESDHRLTEGSVELLLAFRARAKRDFPSAVGVEITDPEGQMFFQSIPTADVPGRQVIAVRYPDQFGGASRLLGGWYNVQWYTVGLDESGLELSGQLPRESFVLSADWADRGAS